MRVCIHRGAEEIGGNCIELESGGSRIVLDLGRPLDAALDEDVPLPPIPGLAKGDDPTLLGVVVSHPHIDHWGLVPQIAPSVPVYMGAAAADMLRQAEFFSPAGADLRPTGHLEDRRPFTLGPFTLTPFKMDHSAFDAYALLVEAGGKRLFYTGDFRGHGAKGKLLDALVGAPPKDVDVLLIEGTNVRPEGEPAIPEVSEVDVERRCAEVFEATPGMALVVYSAQNIDRMTKLYRAAVASGREFVMDLYTATMARATGHPKIPCPGPAWPKLRVFVPYRHCVKVKQSREFERIDWVGRARLDWRRLAARRSRLVMTFRASMARDLEHAGCLEGASLTWSLWRGYLEPGDAMHRFAQKHGLPFEVIHSSGHAWPRDLEKLAAAIAAKRTVRIHTSAPAKDGPANGEWWTVD